MNKPATYLASALAAAIASAILVAAAMAVDAPAAGPAAEPGPRANTARPGSSVLLGWTRLELHASKLIARADAVVERWPAAGEANEVTRVLTEMRYLGQSKLVINISERLDEDGLPVRWMELEPSRKAREWRAEDGRLSKRRFGPPPGRKPPWSGAWTEGHAESIPFNVVSGRTACGGPLDPWTFLTRLHCIAAEPERTFHLFTNGGLVSVRARRAGTRTVTLRLHERPGDKRVETVVEGLRIQLLPAPGEPDPSVFGLSGGLELLVEPVSGALVSVEGKRDDIPGIIRFTLTGLSRTAAPRPDIPWPSEARETSRVP